MYMLALAALPGILPTNSTNVSGYSKSNQASWQTIVFAYPSVKQTWVYVG